MQEGIKHSLKDFDKRLMKQRIDNSDDMQIVLKNSREELLRTFRKEYNAKRTVKATQASHTDNLPKQEDQVV
jgi:septation ring formation regulator EzrA